MSLQAADGTAATLKCGRRLTALADCEAVFGTDCWNERRARECSSVVITVLPGNLRMNYAFYLVQRVQHDKLIPGNVENRSVTHFTVKSLCGL